MKTKVFNFSEWHFSEVTSYKIHTFVNFFRRQHLKKPILTSAIAYSRLVALNWNSFPIFNLPIHFKNFSGWMPKALQSPRNCDWSGMIFFIRWIIQFSFNAIGLLKVVKFLEYGFWCLLKFVFSKKATKIDKIFTVNLALTK